MDNLELAVRRNRPAADRLQVTRTDMAAQLDGIRPQNFKKSANWHISESLVSRHFFYLFCIANIGAIFTTLGQLYRHTDGTLDALPTGESHMKHLVAVASFCALFLTGCAVEKYQAATPQFIGTRIPEEDTAVVVLLKPIFQGAPFSEIVCDNTVGVTWSPEESQHIGFTQRYARTLVQSGPQMAMLAALPTNQRIGMQASGSGQPLNIDSRILVPFGRYITENLKQAIGIAGVVCENEECVSQATKIHPDFRRVLVEFTKFRVAEDERNTLTLEVEGTATVYRSGNAPITVPIRNLISNRSITSEGMWHSDFLKAMNKIANESGSAVAVQIEAAARTL